MARLALRGIHGHRGVRRLVHAMEIEPVAHVCTLGLIELLFSYAISRRVFRERLRGREPEGVALLAVALVVVTLRR